MGSSGAKLITVACHCSLALPDLAATIGERSLLSCDWTGEEEKDLLLGEGEDEGEIYDRRVELFLSLKLSGWSCCKVGRLN